MRVAQDRGGEIDRWGRPRDRTHVEYRFDHAGPGAGAQYVAPDWAAAWK
jgi:hypothetical protein